ncbi:uncharacterized protein LOC17880444 [Capsella rubella]|uniref:uncharacterized protein LOC17880444 n=1 Tax=Capsella rubella TaxID=81985 RepID=UPI000CD5B762|nr:uncharacterized protein LOC17880444 [Capsella rubella]
MTNSRVYLCLIFLMFVTTPPVLCSRSPRLAAPSATIGNRFPFQGWPFHKYAPFPMVKPTNPSVPTTPSSSGAAAEEEESEKVPSSPNKGNRDGGNA